MPYPQTDAATDGPVLDDLSHPMEEQTHTVPSCDDGEPTACTPWTDEVAAISNELGDELCG